MALQVHCQVVHSCESFRAVVVSAGKTFFFSVRIFVSLELESCDKAPRTAWVITLEWLDVVVHHDVQL